MAPGQRCVIDRSVWRGADAVWSGPARSIEDHNFAGLWIEASVDATLAGEPEDATPVEGGRVEVRARTSCRQRKASDCLGCRVDAHDGIQPAIGDPGGTVRPDDNAMWCRSLAQLDMVCLAGRRIEPAQLAGPLGGVPDRAITRRRNVMRVGAG